jgi:hypothetical protein
MNDKKLKPISRYWLLIGVFAVAIAGLYSLTLVFGRAPGLSDNAEIQRIFKDALVVHVDLSVLLWFLAIACLFWSQITATSKHFMPYLEEAALICFSLCIGFMMISPADPKAVAFMSNYIPTISSPLFFLSLGFLLCGVVFMLVKLLSSARISSDYEKPIAFGIFSAGWITLIAICCFVWSYFLMPSIIEGEQYFELLFWGGGHVLQFTHTQILMVVWLLLITALLPTARIAEKALYVLFSVGLLSACFAPFIYLMHDIETAEFHHAFTMLMIVCNGAAPTLLALWIIPHIFRSHHLRLSDNRALWSCVLMSITLFVYGNILGALIQGENVVIPAHYHGSIVGITLAFMGYAYLMLPRFGYKPAAQTKLAYWQPIVYGVGQIMHVSGLAYSGGYGVLRKTVGTAELAPNVKAALGFMGLGGLLAIIGGLMFVIVVAKSIRKPH